MKIITKLFLFLFVFSAFTINLLILAPKEASCSGFLDVSKQEGMKDVAKEYGQSSKPKDIRNVAVDMIKIVLGLLGLIFVILIIVGGFKYMTAAGNDDQVKEARTMILRAAIGLVIILTAFSITVFIVREVDDAATGMTTF